MAGALIFETERRQQAALNEEKEETKLTFEQIAASDDFDIIKKTLVAIGRVKNDTTDTVKFGNLRKRIILARQATKIADVADQSKWAHTEYLRALVVLESVAFTADGDPTEMYPEMITEIETLLKSEDPELRREAKVSEIIVVIQNHLRTNPTPAAGDAFIEDLKRMKGTLIDEFPSDMELASKLFKSTLLFSPLAGQASKVYRVEALRHLATKYQNHSDAEFRNFGSECDAQAIAIETNLQEIAKEAVPGNPTGANKLAALLETIATTETISSRVATLLLTTTQRLEVARHYDLANEAYALLLTALEPDADNFSTLRDAAQKGKKRCDSIGKLIDLNFQTTDNQTVTPESIGKNPILIVIVDGNSNDLAKHLNFFRQYVEPLHPREQLEIVMLFTGLNEASAQDIGTSAGLTYSHLISDLELNSSLHSQFPADLYPAYLFLDRQHIAVESAVHTNEFMTRLLNHIAFCKE